MGIYIETPMSKNKAEQIIELYGAVKINKPLSFSIATDNMLICVVQNGPFDAAALVYNEREFNAFTLPEHRDPRPKTWLLMDRQQALKAVGKTEEDLF